MHWIPMQNNKEVKRKAKPKWAFFLYSSVCAKVGTLVIAFYLFTCLLACFLNLLHFCFIICLFIYLLGCGGMMTTNHKDYQ
jgi:hypothetical protein